MLDLGLTNDEERAYYRALKSSHRARVNVMVANANEHIVESLTVPIQHVVDGAVQVDVSGSVTRQLNLTLLDPKRKLGFIPNHAAQGTLYADRFVAVERGVWVRDLGAWIDAPVFFGPLSGFSHQGPVLTLEAQGKETLMEDPYLALDPYTLHRKAQLDDSIKRVGRRAGEAKFDVPVMRTVLRRHRVVREASEPWLVLKGGETDANGHPIPALVHRGDVERHVFYDGRGYMVVRRAHRNPVLVIGSDLIVEEVPTINYDLLTFRNFVRVVGSKAIGSKRLVRGEAQLPPQHPLSPHALARHGVPRRAAEVHDAALGTALECEDRAAAILDRKAKEGIEVSATIVPIPTLEEGDRVVVHTDEGYPVTCEARQFTIPLTDGASMTIGDTSHIPLKRRRSVRLAGGPPGQHQGGRHRQQPRGGGQGHPGQHAQHNRKPAGVRAR